MTMHAMPPAPLSREILTIGLLGHETSPLARLAPARVRALLGEAALRGIRLVFSTSRDWDRQRGSILADWFGDGAWHRTALPLPHLLIAIAQPSRPEQRALEDALAERTHMLRFKDLQKDESAAALAAAGLRDCVIPEEQLEEDRIEEQLLRWLAGGDIVVKRTSGSLGVGLFFALRAGDKVSLLSDADRCEGSVDEIARRIREAIRGRISYRSYVVQRFVETRDARGQPATIRADIARTPDDNWTIYRLTGRIAIGDKLTSNRARGSALVDIESYLDARAVPDFTGKIAELHARSAEIARNLTALASLAPCYEFGIDFAMDQDFVVWFIEANMRPLTHGAEVERAGHVVPYWIAYAGR